MNKVLFDIVLEQIREDVQIGDFSSIEELLQFVPEVYLRGYLTEEKQAQLYEMESPR